MPISRYSARIACPYGFNAPHLQVPDRVIVEVSGAPVIVGSVLHIANGVAHQRIVGRSGTGARWLRIAGGRDHVACQRAVGRVLVDAGGRVGSLRSERISEGTG